MTICPKCGKETDRLLSLSRTDNKTMICDACGTCEALDAAGLTDGSSVRSAILGEIYRKKSSQEQVKSIVMATGNRWAMENFREIHS